MFDNYFIKDFKQKYFIKSLMLLIFIGIFIFFYFNSIVHFIYINFPELFVYKKTNNRIAVPFSTIRNDTNVMILLVLGQSNSANYGNELYNPKEKVYNFYEGNLYKATDPLLGCSGEGGTIWTRFADMLIKQGYYSQVVLIPIGIGSSKIKQWVYDGNLNSKLIKTIDSIQKNNLKITHVFWMQGESDCCVTPAEKYKNMFHEIVKCIKKSKVDAPIFISITTRQNKTIDKELQKVQAQLPLLYKNIFYGPNTDEINNKNDRYDGIHFSAIGQNQCAKLWVESIKNWYLQKK